MINGMTRDEYITALVEDGYPLEIAVQVADESEEEYLNGEAF